MLLKLITTRKDTNPILFYFPSAMGYVSSSHTYCFLLHIFYTLSQCYIYVLCFFYVFCYVSVLERLLQTCICSSVLWYELYTDISTLMITNYFVFNKCKHYIFHQLSEHCIRCLYTLWNVRLFFTSCYWFSPHVSFCFKVLKKITISCLLINFKWPVIYQN